MTNQTELGAVYDTTKTPTHLISDAQGEEWDWLDPSGMASSAGTEGDPTDINEIIAKWGIGLSIPGILFGLYTLYSLARNP